ncbi:MAG: histidine phosphatase family protein, partial [Clostridia bacterium]|nr:histidine phosphatase family protein [Clostridia bacterium]
MRIIFVRHGHPDYSKDCLTEMGHLQAQAAAKRLCDEKIEKIYSSTCGRAFETAQYIAAVHGLDIEQLDFMREIRWGSVDENPVPHDGHPWYTADDMASRGQKLLNPDWDKTEPYCRNKAVDSVKNVGDNFDALLETLGYKREGDYYRV